MEYRRLQCPFLDGYCSTVQGLLDWFEVDLGFTEILFIQVDLCVTCICIHGYLNGIEAPTVPRAPAHSPACACCGAARAHRVSCSVLQSGAVCCSVLQCAAVCCSVLQCVAVCCARISSQLQLYRESVAARY